ncbi:MULTISPECIES: replication protein [Enterobacter cloacae complex]|uniref:replication protein n=1 Tax=Enterobacter cloacae complex TaxID=354276 RepID=UPI000445AFA6|nr:MULTISPECIES: replication protein [Enterobacter cloacae complex]AWR71258.1 replication protein [Enterobacter hormaechei subsp. xiangfangensis]AXM02060.1 replication protein [Enterobacter hormaechei subsp. xiangfangensis]EHK3215405.1 replication protein [Enterobacter hormaechei]EHK3220477.1 replication protein [Enterobacter hormaechei]EHK3225317.1 replication protein [Enterobacter hormaechei]
MENQKTGFIPLYRSVLKKPWAKDVFLRTLWENLLLGAARQPYTANFKGRQWPLQTGQLVTTTADLGLKLCDREGKPSSRHAVDRMLDVFEREGMISRSGEKRKGTVITITNYEQYAQKIDDLPAQFPAHNGEHFTAHDEASSGAACEGHAAHLPAHKTAQFPAHHEQQYNNNNINNKISSSRNSEESRNEATQKFLSRHPEAADGIYTPAGKSWGTADDLKAARWIHSLRLTVNASLSEPKWVEWANTIRLMRVQDKRTHFEICDLFKWANKDDFWKDNILSPSSLRRKWDDLTTKRLRSGGQPTKTTAKGKVDFNNTDWINGVFDEKSF